MCAKLGWHLQYQSSSNPRDLSYKADTLQESMALCQCHFWGQHQSCPFLWWLIGLKGLHCMVLPGSGNNCSCVSQNWGTFYLNWLIGFLKVSITSYWLRGLRLRELSSTKGILCSQPDGLLRNMAWISAGDFTALSLLTSHGYHWIFWVPDMQKHHKTCRTTQHTCVNVINTIRAAVYIYIYSFIFTYIYI